MRARTFLIGIMLVLGGNMARAQWVVTDPGNLAQSIINMSDNIAHTSKTAVNTADNFAETVKIYEQAKKYYDRCNRRRWRPARGTRSCRRSSSF